MTKSKMCNHEEICTESKTCILCGLCNIDNSFVNILIEKTSFISQTRVKPRSNICSETRRLINFRNIINKKSGNQICKIKPKELKNLGIVIKFLYGSSEITERKIQDTLKKIHLIKYVNDSYLIKCILKNEKPIRFDKYIYYFEYMYIKLFDIYFVRHAESCSNVTSMLSISAWWAAVFGTVAGKL